MRYYMTVVEEKNYAVDQNKLKEYFPLNVVTKGVLGNLFVFESVKLVILGGPGVVDSNPGWTTTRVLTLNQLRLCWSGSKKLVA